MSQGNLLGRPLFCEIMKNQWSFVTTEMISCYHKKNRMTNHAFSVSNTSSISRNIFRSPAVDRNKKELRKYVKTIRAVRQVDPFYDERLNHLFQSIESAEAFGASEGEVGDVILPGRVGARLRFANIKGANPRLGLAFVEDVFGPGLAHGRDGLVLRVALHLPSRGRLESTSRTRRGHRAGEPQQGTEHGHLQGFLSHSNGLSRHPRHNSTHHNNEEEPPPRGTHWRSGTRGYLERIYRTNELVSRV